MKTVVKELEYEKVLALPKEKQLKPVKPALILRWLMKTLGRSELKAVNFKTNYIGMEKLGKHEPCLILMNHSCFTDLIIAETVFADRPMNIVCTSDGFVGKNMLMRHLGCIPTNKFVTDFVLVKNMKYAVEKLRTSVLMYPEASYSFDGMATPLPDTLGKCLKLLNVPVIVIRTYGAFTRDPLYNNLQKRKVDVSADVKYLLSPEEIAGKSVDELNEVLKNEFTFDNWKWQRENNVRITEPFRADFLNRVLYKCTCCGTEGKMLGKGVNLSCNACGAVWTLTEYGTLEQISPSKAAADNQPDKQPAFDNVPDWFSWQREQVRAELAAGTYRLDVPVEIYMMVNTKAIYYVGDGRLQHSPAGFVLDGCDGRLHYEQKPRASYSLYSDYYWYEIGDMVCIGGMKTLYYCFPKNAGDIAAKARIATEELYKLNKPSLSD
ncbi:MAG: 1-acyl-sn-glycerol-3-phosphate acyltransferase [Spirochaetaceae bacterium]|nr:1-acyl-sn-glycerol-3-phosphate acyltransferase [Spirochaetaceae bacterium]